jgi:hypothetical protein
MQVSKTTHLFVADFGVKYTYVVNWRCGEGGGNFLSRPHFIAEATSPLRDANKNKNKADHSSS